MLLSRALKAKASRLNAEFTVIEMKNPACNITVVQIRSQMQMQRRQWEDASKYNHVVKRSLVHRV